MDAIVQWLAEQWASEQEELVGPEVVADYNQIMIVDDFGTEVIAKREYNHD